MNAHYNVKRSVLVAFAHILGPLVRILIRNGISFYEFAEVAKETYVKVCERDFALESERLTDARIAILTGLTRQDVARIRSSTNRSNSTDLRDNFVPRVLEGWHEDKDFLGPYGLPRDLPIDPDDSGMLCFSDLVGRYAGGMSVSAVIDELLRGDAVVFGEDKRTVRVTQRAYIRTGLTPETAESFAKTVRRFVDTVDANYHAAGKADKRFERVVLKADGIKEEDWDRFRTLVAERMQPVLEDLDSRLSHFDPAASGDNGGPAIGVGVYIFREEMDASAR